MIKGNIQWRSRWKKWMFCCRFGASRCLLVGERKGFWDIWSVYCVKHVRPSLGIWWKLWPGHSCKLHGLFTKPHLMCPSYCGTRKKFEMPGELKLSTAEAAVPKAGLVRNSNGSTCYVCNETSKPCKKWISHIRGIRLSSTKGMQKVLTHPWVSIVYWYTVGVLKNNYSAPMWFDTL